MQIDQPQGGGSRVVGTGFLIASRRADGSPETVLVTADHVLSRMPGASASIGYRFAGPDGDWTYRPQQLRIRDEAGAPLWTRHPSRDVAAMRIEAPAAFAQAAIPKDYLATGEALSPSQISLGQELMVLGFPRGLAADTAGFPILRSGRVAAYPRAGGAAASTFLLDFTVFPGNSGGPVFAAGQLSPQASGAQAPFIAGLLTQQVELNRERLDIGVVTHAKYVGETIDLMENAAAPVTRAKEKPVTTAATPASQVVQKPGLLARCLDWLKTTAKPYWDFQARVVAWFFPGDEGSGAVRRAA